MFLLIPLLLLALAGCASAPSKPPVTLEQVVQMSREGVPPGDIIAKMRDSDTVYRLSGSQLARLKQQGVSDEVLDYMQDTYLRDMQLRGRMYAYDPYWWGPYPGWGPYPSWAWAYPYPYPYYVFPSHRHREPNPPPTGGRSSPGVTFNRSGLRERQPSDTSPPPSRPAAGSFSPQPSDTSPPPSRPASSARKPFTVE
ncbi:MAG TPA: hypothetical protein VFB54_06690 [Burkholderiales bacterium]|nr:hypothetical protein [Burkholderiales bacterium]